MNRWWGVEEKIYIVIPGMREGDGGGSGAVGVARNQPIKHRTQLVRAGVRTQVMRDAVR